MSSLCYYIFSVGHLQQRFKADSNINANVNSFTNCEMTDLLKHRSKTPSSTIPCAPAAVALPSSLNASIHAPYAPGKEVITIPRLMITYTSRVRNGLLVVFYCLKYFP